MVCVAQCIKIKLTNQSSTVHISIAKTKSCLFETALQLNSDFILFNDLPALSTFVEQIVDLCLSLADKGH